MSQHGGVPVQVAKQPVAEILEGAVALENDFQEAARVQVCQASPLPLVIQFDLVRGLCCS